VTAGMNFRFHDSTLPAPPDGAPPSCSSGMPLYNAAPALIQDA
jgi:hypothetical protein